MRTSMGKTIEQLKEYDTATISNAIEAFGIRGRDEGFMRPEIRSVFPGMGVLVGFACTCKIAASRFGVATHNAISLLDYWESILRIPPPRVVVIQDLDYPNVVGSCSGAVQANVHKALGCDGVVTNGGVRDLDELRTIGFNAFSSHILVSRAYVRLVEIDVKVRVGGLDVSPGDLMHADKHGVLKVPKEIAKKLPAQAAKAQKVEKEFIEKCRAFAGDLSALRRDFDTMTNKRDSLK